MKILYISPYPPAQDGIGTYTRMLAHAMRDLGNDVRVIVPRHISGSPSEVLGTISLAGKNFVSLHNKITRWNPDIVHVQFAIAAFGTRTFGLMRWLEVLRREWRVPIIVTLHELTRETTLLRAAGRGIYRWIAAHCDLLIIHTDTAREALIDKLGVSQSKSVVIPHPTAGPPAGKSTPDDLRKRFDLHNARILLSFGFIHVDKGLDDLIRALGILRDSTAVQLDDVRIVVAGAVRPRHGPFRAMELRDRWYLVRVLRLARHMSLQEYLVLTGYVPEGDVAAWFLAAEAVVLPYRRTEQSGVAGLAGSFGVPVLASTVGGLAEQFAGSRWTFPPRNPERIAETLNKFLDAEPAEQAQLVPARRPSDLTSVITATMEHYATFARASIGESDVA